MSQPIKAGDLVQVVRPQPCCGGNASGGIIFIVKEVTSHLTHCKSCRASFQVATVVKDPRDDCWVLASRVKRIPPLDELDGVKRDEKLMEPA